MSESYRKASMLVAYCALGVLVITIIVLVGEMVK